MSQEIHVYKNFKDIGAYRKDFSYNLFHFNFKNHGDKILLVNDNGEYLFCTKEELIRLVKKQLDPIIDEGFIRDLLNKQFIYLASDPFAIERNAVKYRTKKKFLYSGAILHLFVVTTRCQHKCLYCQITPQSEKASEYDMSYETARKAVEMMLQAPSDKITVKRGVKFCSFF